MALCQLGGKWDWFLCRWHKYLEDIYFAELLKETNTWKKNEIQDNGRCISGGIKSMVWFAYRNFTERSQMTLFWLTQEGITVGGRFQNLAEEKRGVVSWYLGIYCH